MNEACINKLVGEATKRKDLGIRLSGSGHPVKHVRWNGARDGLGTGVCRHQRLWNPSLVFPAVQLQDMPVFIEKSDLIDYVGTPNPGRSAYAPL